VIDTGVDYTHPDLAANMWRNEADCNSNGIDDDGNGYIDDCYGIDTVNGGSNPMDDEGHGTHVAGIIGATGNNSTGVVGVAWNVKIMPCKFLDASGTGTVADAIDCLDYVRMMKSRGVNIIATNNSWAGSTFSHALRDAIELQRQAGILFIAAAGGLNNDTDPVFPASYYLPNIISVSESNNADFSPVSAYGSATVHIVAPGRGILSTVPGNNYAYNGGSSMGAAHVTGVAVLLKAQDGNRDWVQLKNLILAGGDDLPALLPSITGKRLNAQNSLTCANSPVLARLQPTEDQGNGDIRIGSVINLAALHINCEVPNGEVNVVIAPGGQLVTLRDDGSGFDQVAGDGVYSGQWTATSGGTFNFTFPDGDVVSVEVDPDLKPGFPVKAFTYFGFFDDNGLQTLVGNVDSDPDLEIIVTGLPSGPLYAWKSDGSLVPGWPVSNNLGGAYPTLGQLSNQSPSLEIAAGHTRDLNNLSYVSAYDGSGSLLAGWPNRPGSIFRSPMTADIDGDGLDEIFTSVGTLVYAYKADGTLLPGWPISPVNELFTGTAPSTTGVLAAGDLDGDGRPEIVFTYGNRLLAYRYDGTLMPGFPVSGIGHGAVVIGDVDGDGSPEIIVTDLYNSEFRIVICRSDGTPIRAIKPELTPNTFGGSLALADLDGDGILEIVVQTENDLTVLRGNGTTYPGWPVSWGPMSGPITSAPVIGDIDGDGFPDIVVVNRLNSGDWGELRAYNRAGSLLPRFPKRLLIERGGVPAIADLDLDGRNEIIVTAGLMRFVPGDYNKVWAYDLGGPAHGAVQWGQWMGGPKHQGVYKPESRLPQSLLLSIRKEGLGTGTVTSQSLGISCGNTCSRVYNATTTEMLSAVAGPGSVFLGWYGGGCGGTGTCTAIVTADTTVTAIFDSQVLTSTTLAVDSVNPSIGVIVTTSPPAISGASGGMTPFSHTFDSNASVTLTAPATPPGKIFMKWLRDGQHWAATLSTQVAMANNHTMTAVYEASNSVSPDVVIISGPTGTMSNMNATFTWSGTDDITPTGNLVYAYRLDPIETHFSAFGSATTKSYSSLPVRTFTFFVKARDEAGNESIIPASRIFSVVIDAYGPNLVINSPINQQVVTSILS
jgi:hypothetical protein